jgi:flavodoxin
MKSLVIYATTSGNTQSIAQAIAERLRRRGSVEVMTADQAPANLPEADLVFIGGPTERHTLTEPIVRLFDRLSPGSLRGTAAVAFDTRLRWPRLLSGSAADEIAKRLRAAGAHLAARPESFMVSMEPKLEPGEIARAAAWATNVAEAVEPSTAAGATLSPGNELRPPTGGPNIWGG